MLITSIGSITFVIFLAALPGRTTFLILLLASRSKLLPILAGSIAAFSIQALISVLFGSLLGKLPHHWIALASGLIFLFFGAKIWRERTSGEENAAPMTEVSTHSFFLLARNAFLSVFIAEWGDISQLAIASVAAQNENHLIVWISASIALAFTALFAVSLGSRIHKLVSSKTLHMISFFTFTGMGIYFLVKAFLNWGT